MCGALRSRACVLGLPTGSAAPAWWPSCCPPRPRPRPSRLPLPCASWAPSPPAPHILLLALAARAPE
eukprot:930418-Pyramimonas_sp.AAC.1